MKVKNLGLVSTKIKDIDNQFPIQDILVKTGQLEQYGSGIFAYGHIPYLVKENIKKVINEELYSASCTLVNLPILQPQKLWEDSGRLKRYVDDEIMFRCLTEKGNYCLAPTAEEAVVAFAKNKLVSYKDLPCTFYQIGEKFRDEIRCRGVLLRGKSFEMMDAYSFNKSEEDLNVSYDTMRNAYFNIFNRLSLDVLAVKADSGAIGGNQSEEFMVLSEIGEDKIYYNPKTGDAFNEEIIEKVSNNKEEYEIKRSVELGHIFNLGTKYSKSMNLTYVNEEGTPTHTFMGCYGIGVSRTLAMVYEKSIIRNDKGEFDRICLPCKISPYYLYIVCKTDDENKEKIAANFYNKFESVSVPCLYDDREGVSIGSKIKDYKITGAPYLIVFGNTLDENYVELENNRTGQKEKIDLEELASVIENRYKEEVL